MMETKKPVGSTTTGSQLLEQIEKLALWQRVAAVAAVVVLLLGGAAWFVYLPIYEELDQLDQKLQGLEKKLATAKINAAELEKFQLKIQEAEAQFKIAMRALPEKEEIPSLLTNISKSGHEIGLEFLLFEPKAENKKDFYAEIPVVMNLRGDYHSLAIFFDKVARLSRIVNITNITINRGKDGKDARDLSSSCTAVTYKFVEAPPENPEGVKPPGDKPGAKRPDVKPKTKSKKLDL
jgi:type IV pilus assembly protein PilO